MPLTAPGRTTPWRWVPTLYLAEGWPYALVISVALVCYKNLGVANPAATFYTSLLYLPWVLKPLWSPAVDLLHTRRRWIWTMELLAGLGLAGVALAVAAPDFFLLTLAGFWLVATASATHDIAADGFYLLALTERQQALFSGVRNTFYRLAGIAAQGGLILLAGDLHARGASLPRAWRLAFGLAAGCLLLLAAYHRWRLPRPVTDHAGITRRQPGLGAGFFVTFQTFFQKPRILTVLAFLLLYRFGEAQLGSVSRLFLLEARDRGGLGLTDVQYGWLYGVGGVAALLAGGVLGGVMIARNGLKFWWWPMALALHLPDAIFIWLAHARPDNLLLTGAGVAVEQFGYGFGFAAFMFYLLCLARGPHATAHYALCTGFMAVGMMAPGLWSGWLQQQLGYRNFFLWVLLATLPGFYLAARVPLGPEAGRRPAREAGPS